MPRLILSFLIIILAANLAAQNTGIRILTQPSWPQGEFVPVVIEIENPDADGFARFYQNLPQGFTVRKGSVMGSDFYWDNNQVNFVWVKLPEQRIIRVGYFAKADQALSGSFRMAGQLDYVLSGSERRSSEAAPVLIKLDKNAVVEADTLDYLAEEVKEVNEAEEAEKEQKDEPESVNTTDVSFRVQVAISSDRITKDELEERIDCQLKYNITVLRTGNMFKYQSGSFGLYNEASAYLKELKQLGVNDAFVVAYRGDEQISVNLARTLTE